MVVSSLDVPVHGFGAEFDEIYKNVSSIYYLLQCFLGFFNISISLRDTVKGKRKDKTKLNDTYHDDTYQLVIVKCKIVIRVDSTMESNTSSV